MTRQLCSSVDEVFALAIAEGQKAVVTYRAVARQAPTPGVKSVFAGFAADEETRFRKLLRMRRAAVPEASADALHCLPRRRPARLPPGGIPDAEAAYRYAIRAGRSAHQLYTLLGGMTQSPTIRQVFNTLANEELCRRARLEANLKQQRTPLGLFRRLLRFVTRRRGSVAAL